MIDNKRVAIISSGNGGQAFAAYYAWKGYKAGLYARERERVEMFQSNEFIMSGEVNEKVTIDLITHDMEKVLKDARLIMVTTPSQFHNIVAREMAPYLQDDQIIILNPGRSFGTTEFMNILKRHHVEKNVIVAEVETFLFTCRCIELGKPNIYKIKDSVMVSAHYKEDTPQVVETLKDVFPSITGAQSILDTAFGNMGIIFHPVPALMNLTRMENKERILHYKQAISPLVARMLEKLDSERVMLAEKAGIQTAPVLEWLRIKYGSCGRNLYECLQNTDAYNDVLTPTDIYTRYIFEDIPTGCVPMLAIGKHLGVKTPMLESIVNWATEIYGFDFYQHGRNEDKIPFKEILEINR